MCHQHGPDLIAKAQILQNAIDLVSSFKYRKLLSATISAIQPIDICPPFSISLKAEDVGCPFPLKACYHPLSCRPSPRSLLDRTEVARIGRC